MTYKWNYLTITPQQAEEGRQLAQALGISPILARLLVERGITTVQAARKFFRPQLPELHDPFLMKDMDAAVERLNRAMGRKASSSNSITPTSTITFRTATTRATACR